MNIKLIFYGQTSELARNSNLSYQFEGETVLELLEELKKHYPKLEALELKIAVNNQFEQFDYKLNENDDLSILPPFSGG